MIVVDDRVDRVLFVVDAGAGHAHGQIGVGPEGGRHQRLHPLQQLGRPFHDALRGLALLLGQHLPGHDVGVMLERRQHDFVAGTDELAAVAVHDEIDAVGGAADAGHQPRHRAPGARHHHAQPAGRAGPLAGRVDLLGEPGEVALLGNPGPPSVLCVHHPHLRSGPRA